MGWLRNKFFDLAARVLTKPRGNYTLLLPNDFDALLKVIRPGDVILVDGDQRVSEVIKYLTQSSWSHSVLYVGDEILRRHPDDGVATVYVERIGRCRVVSPDVSWQGAVELEKL